MKDYKHANVHGQGRMLRAMVAWYQYTGNPKWKQLVDRMVDGLDKHLVVHKDNYAYVPAHGWIEDNEYFRSCYTEKGWKDTTEPGTEKEGEEGSLFNHQGHLAGALATWHTLTGNEQAFRRADSILDQTKVLGRLRPRISGRGRIGARALARSLSRPS